MKFRSYLFLSSSALLFHIYSYCQNIGINIVNPTRAKMELNGMVGNTTAIFGGDGTGIGVIASSPEIGFNAYYNAGTRYMSNGYAAVQFFAPGPGYFGIDVHGTGLRDAIVSGPATRRAITLLNNIRVGIGNNPGFNATLNVANYPGFNSTAYIAGTQFTAFNYSASENTIISGGDADDGVYFNQDALNSKIAFGDGSGLVGICWNLPVYPLEIHSPSTGGFGIGLMRESSNHSWTISENNGGLLKLYFSTTTSSLDFIRTQKGVFSNSTGSYSPSSDIRIKKNIQPLSSMLSRILQLKPQQYEMINNNPGRDQTFGLIAQEVKEIFPALVHVCQATNTGYKNISDLHMLNYSGLASPIVKALQEQQLMLNELENKLEKMELQKQEPHGNKSKHQ